MPIMTDGPTLEPQNKGIDEFHVGRMESFGADISEAVSDLPSVQLKNLLTAPDQDVGSPGAEADALGNVLPSSGPSIAKTTRPAVPRMDIIEANDRVKKAGLASVLTLPNQPDIPPSQLEIMMTRAQARKEREATIERGPQGFVQSALSTGTSFLVGAVDPINIGSAFIPVMGELRYAKLLETAGEGFGARMAVRAGVGAAQGAVGQAALEPLDWWSHTQDGRDFGMSDVLHNVLFGAVLGGSLHAAGGAVSDAWRARQGRALYPFGPGEPMENVRGTHVSGSMLAEEGVKPAALEEHFAGAAIEPHDAAAHEPIFPEAPDDHHVTPAALSAEVAAAKPAIPSPAVQTIDDLPQRAREDAARAGIANLIDGEPLRVGEMLEVAAKTDPRIAESFEAWHGSPHEFDRFDLSKLGTGEGAQAYGHGLYVAENEKVARSYQRATSDKAFIDKVATLYDEGFSPDDAWAEVKGNWSDFTPAEQRLMTALEKDDWLGFEYPHQAVSAALSDPKGKRWEMSPETIDAIKHVGHMYKVRINADHEHFLDWDKPLDEQSEHVRRALLEHPDPMIAGTAAKHGHNVSNVYTRIAVHLGNRSGQDFDSQMRGGGYSARQSMASRALAEAGIPGIKYLDQGSRDRGAGTRNFVVFDDKHIEITHKNGEPVNKEKFLQERADERAQHVTAKPARGRAAADPETWSLYEFLAHEGGLRPDPELEAIFGSHKGPFVPGFGALVRPSGRSLDDALRLAKDHGYMFDAADVTGAEGRLTPNDLLDRLAEENSGRKQYRNDQQFATKAELAADLEREKHEIISALHDEIEASTGQKGLRVDPALEDRVVQIVIREGEHDVLAAYERAIMEDAERYEGLANERQNHPETADVPGWDRPDAGAASLPGAADPRPRRQGRLSQQEAGETDGGEPRSAGNGDRAAGANVLDRDAAWRQLSHAQPEFDDPQVIAASNAAAKVEAPKSRLDERLTAAEKADAYAKQMYDMFADRLPEGDRQRLDDLIKTIDSDHEAREIAIKQGGACLFGARA